VVVVDADVEVDVDFDEDGDLADGNALEVGVGSDGVESFGTPVSTSFAVARDVAAGEGIVAVERSWLSTDVLHPTITTVSTPTNILRRIITPPERTAWWGRSPGGREHSIRLRFRLPERRPHRCRGAAEHATPT
jgi:hypothetical protein